VAHLRQRAYKAGAVGALKAGLSRFSKGSVATSAREALAKIQEEAEAEAWAETPWAETREGADTLQRMCDSDASLTELLLGHHSISDIGASALAEALKVNRTLTALELQNNSIGDAGASAVAVASKVNRTLLMLWLPFNSIGDAGASALAEALKVNRTLKMLVLSNNSIGEAGVQALRSSVRSGCELFVSAVAPALAAALSQL